MKTYGSKEMAIIPINYTDAKIKAEDPFYDNLEFGFTDNPAKEKSFCTDFVHDVIYAGGVTSIIIDNENVIDISSVMNNISYLNKLAGIMKKHSLPGGTKYNPKIMSFYYSDVDLHNTPLPINIAKKLQEMNIKFNP
jgi:hypothetical protein